MELRLIPKLAGSAAVALMLFVTPGVSYAQETGDVLAGAKVFTKQCAQCHVLGTEMKTGLAGPPLNGIVGRKSATTAEFNYSPQMRSARLTWDVPVMTRYLRSPKGLIPGTRMLFNGLSAPKDIADVIAFLETFDSQGVKKQ